MSLIAVLIASLLGSAHCAGMCGGFVAFFSGREEVRPIVQVYYHGGRLIIYILLGVVAGQVGSALDLAGGTVGFQRVAALLAGLFLILWGVRGLLGKGMHVQSSTLLPVYTGLRRVFGRVLEPDSELSWSSRALALGVLSGFLPCGWLYAYLAVAASSAEPLAGGVIMAVFWVGTVPALVGVAGITRLLSSRLRRFTPATVSVLLIVAGIYSLYLHTAPSVHHHDHHPALSSEDSAERPTEQEGSHHHPPPRSSA